MAVIYIIIFLVVMVFFDQQFVWSPDVLGALIVVILFGYYSAIVIIGITYGCGGGGFFCLRPVGS